MNAVYAMTFKSLEQLFKDHTWRMPLIARFMGPTWGPIWGLQDPGGPHVGPMNFAIWGSSKFLDETLLFGIYSHVSTPVHYRRLMAKEHFFIGSGGLTPNRQQVIAQTRNDPCSFSMRQYTENSDSFSLFYALCDKEYSILELASICRGSEKLFLITNHVNSSIVAVEIRGIIFRVRVGLWPITYWLSRVQVKWRWYITLTS